MDNNFNTASTPQLNDGKTDRSNASNKKTTSVWVCETVVPSISSVQNGWDMQLDNVGNRSCKVRVPTSSFFDMRVENALQPKLKESW